MAEANKLYSFTLPSPYQAELAKIADQQRLAEVLQAQSQAPTERFSYKGIEAQTPITAGLAKALQGFGGAYFQGQGREQEKALGERYRAEQSADFTNLAKMLSAPAVAGSAAVPERLAEPPTIPVDDEGNAMPGVSAAPAVPSVTARRAGQIDPEMIGQFKTPETQQMAMAQLLAQIGPKTPIKASAGDVFFDAQGRELFRAPEKQEFGTTPHYEMINGVSHAVVYDKQGNKKDLGPATAQNQFTTPTVDAQAKLAQDRAISDRNFNQLSADQRAKLDLEGKRLNISGAELFFNTGMKAGGAAPMPPAAAPSMLPVPGAMPAGAAAPTGQPVGQPVPSAVAPTMQRSARIGMAPARAAQPAAPAFAPNAVGPNGQIVQTAAGAVQLTGKERQRLAGAAIESQQNKEQKMAGFGDAIAEARQILTGTNPLTGNAGTEPLPTASGVGSLVDYLGNLGGVAPRGQNEAKRLEVVAGILTSKVPRMEGPQSDKDVELYKKMAGDAGNSGLPISTRLSALDTMQRLFSKYERLNPNTPESNQPARENQPGRYKVDF
jgi:hypothetical protein